MNLFSNPLFLLFICLGLVFAVYGGAILQRMQGRMGGFGAKFGQNRTDVAKWSSVGAIVLITDLVLYLLMYYVGTYAFTNEWPSFGFHTPIFAFLSLSNVLFGALYYLGFFERAGDKSQPTCRTHGTNYERGCNYCQALADTGQIKFQDEDESKE